MRCIYRAIFECRMPKRISTPINCQLCLMGQQADEIGLLTSAVMNLSMENIETESIEQKRFDDEMDDGEGVY